MNPAQLSAGRLLAICSARVFLFATFMTVAAVIPLITVEWALSATAAGAIVSSFTFCYAASVFGFAWAADHFGAKRMVAVSAIAAAAASAAFGFLARDWWSAVLAYGLVGLAQGGVYTPLVMLLLDEVAPASRGRAMGWLIASTSAGYCASLGAAALGIAFGGWQAAFVLSGLLPAVGALVLLAAIAPFANRIHPRPAQVRLRDEIVHNHRASSSPATPASWELLGMWAWVPAFLAAGFASGCAVAARPSPARGSRLLHAAAPCRLCDGAPFRPHRAASGARGAAAAPVASFVIGWLVHAPSAILVPLALAYAFFTLGDSPVLTTAISEAVRPGYLGAVLAWRGFAGFGAGAVAPLAVGLVLDAAAGAGASPAVSWGLSFVALGFGGAIALACALALRPAR
jgi:hypothetical protein